MMKPAIDAQAESALASALQNLLARGTLDQPQAEAVRDEFRAQISGAHSDGPERSKASLSMLLTEVGGYIGAAFVVAAATALVGPAWGDFSTVVQATLLFVPGLLLLVGASALAMSMPGGWSARVDRIGLNGVGGPYPPAEDAGPRRRLVAVLVLAAGGLVTAGTGVLVEDVRVALVALAVWGAGYVVCRGQVLHLATTAALIWSPYAVVSDQSGSKDAIAGLLLVGAAIVWTVLSVRGVVEERGLGIATAGLMAFIGAETVTINDPAALGYLLLVALAAAGLVGYLKVRELSALGVGAISMAVVVPQAVIEYAGDSLGAAGGLLISGLSIVAASVLAGRLRQRPPAEDVGSAPAQLM